MSRSSSHRRALLLVLALACAAAFLTACGDDDSDSDSDAGGDTTTAIAGVTGAQCGDVIYDGDGDPDALIVSDLPLQGDSAERSEQMNLAIQQVLDDNDWKAGDQSIAFQACDDSIAKTGLWDEATCKENAAAYAATREVIGVIGTYNSGCAELMIPILGRARGGGLAMISPGNTAVCLTESAETCENGTPDSLYPGGKRNYARVVPNDAFQGAAQAKFLSDGGSKRVSVLYAADDPTSMGQAVTFENAARAAGLTVGKPMSWDPEAKDYSDLMNKVQGQDPDALLLAGLTEQNGGQLIKDKVKALGTNDGEVMLIAPDGFAQQSTIDEAGEAATGMYATVPGRAPELLSGRGQELADEISDEVDGEPVELYAPYAGQAADVMLDAVASAGLDRPGVISSIFGTKVVDGITGSFTITPTGDPSEGPVTISVAEDTFVPQEAVTAPDSLVEAARG